MMVSPKSEKIVYFNAPQASLYQAGVVAWQTVCVMLVFTRTETNALNVLQTLIQQSTACLQQPVGVILVSPKSEKIVNAPQAPLQ